LKDERKKEKRTIHEDRTGRERKWQRLKTTKNCNLRIDVFTTVKYIYKEMEQPFEPSRKQVDVQSIV